MNSNDFGVSIVATPIGNLDDITKRAVKTIEEADLIICENPKHSLKLLNKLGIKKKLISLHDYNETRVIRKISEKLKKKTFVLISDAGSPLISDPGYKLVNYCANNNINVTSIPGPSSLIPALQLSGLPINEFFFAGFLPKNKNGIIDFITKIIELNKTSVFFVSNHKIKICLDIIEKLHTDVHLSVSKELTKMNENIWRGNTSEIRDEILKNKDNLKGEFVIVMRVNKRSVNNTDTSDKYNDEIKMLLSKFSLTDVVQIVHKITGINKNKVYKWVLKIKEL